MMAMLRSFALLFDLAVLSTKGVSQAVIPHALLGLLLAGSSEEPGRARGLVLDGLT